MSLLKPDFQPAKLRETSYRWYIELWVPERKRPTFGLNRIHNLEERRRRGYELCELLNWWLMAGLSLDRWTETEARRRKAEAQRTTTAPRGHTDIRRAILYAAELKNSLIKNEDSTRSYSSHSRLFVNFLESQEWELMPADEIRRHHIVAWLDYRRITDKVRNTTINNNLRSIRTLFNLLVDRGFAISNPCDKIAKLPGEPKKRRAFTLAEAKVFIPYIYDHDKTLCLAVLMQFCCYMRPKEILNCRRGYIDLAAGVIRLPADSHKTGRKIGATTKTIPTAFLAYFKELVPTCRSSWYIFGKGYRPSSEVLRKNTMYEKHQNRVKELQGKGLLANTVGLTYYSWKDTGITEDLKYIALIGVQGQAGHTSPNMTMTYYEKPQINEHMLEKRNEVLPIKKEPVLPEPAPNS